jgi:cytosine/adenosine deaminase-related metal-dependent hydrolase
LGGATTIVEENFGGAEMWIELVERLGFRSSIGLTYPGNVSAIGYVHDGRIIRDDSFDVAAGLQRGLQLHDDWNGALDDRLRVHLSPHASDTVPEEVLRETKRLAKERGTTIHLHLAQHLSENETIRERTGESPIEYLARIGFLGADVLATHVTYTDGSDWGILASTQTNIIHCAYRKAKEGLTSPFWEYLERGVNVAIATDSFSHDLVENLKLTALLGKVREREVGHPRADHVVACATHGAAQALRRPDLGILQPGARGDIAVIDLSTPFNAPVFDPLKSLVYYSNGADLKHSIVDGRPIVADRQVLGSDISAVAERATAACIRLWELAREQGALPEPAAPAVAPTMRA